MKIVAREQLDQAGCESACTHDHSVLFIHGRCHPHAKVAVAYVKATGLLEFRCGQCAQEIVAVQVARRVVE